MAIPTHAVADAAPEFSAGAAFFLTNSRAREAPAIVPAHLAIKDRFTKKA